MKLIKRITAVMEGLNFTELTATHTHTRAHSTNKNESFENWFWQSLKTFRLASTEAPFPVILYHLTRDPVQ